MSACSLTHSPTHAAQYHIYLWGNTWSTSLKRLLLTNSVVFLPAVNPHESFVSVLLAEGCKDCFLYYDADNLCTSVMEQLNQTTDTTAQQMAQRMTDFARSALSLSNVLHYMANTLKTIASSGTAPFPNNTVVTPIAAAGADDSPEELQIDGRVLRRVTCASLKASHKKMTHEHGTSWQVRQDEHL